MTSTTGDDFITVPGNSEERRAFLQARVALFGRMLAIMSAVFLAASATSYFVLTPEPSLLTRVALDKYDLLAIALFLTLWLVARRGRLPLRVLEGLEAGVTLFTCTGYALMVAGTDQELNIARGQPALRDLRLLPRQPRRGHHVDPQRPRPDRLRDLLGRHGDRAQHDRLAHHLRPRAEGAGRAQARAAHAGGADRPGRDGRRLPRRARHAQAPDRGEGAAPRQDGGRQPRPLRTRGAADEPAHPPEHGLHLRLRPNSRRPLLLRDGVPRRLHALRARRGRRSPAPGAHRLAHAPGGRLPRRGARHRSHPLRHQAGQHHRLCARRRRRRGQGPRLRTAEGVHLARSPALAGGRPGGHAALHVTRGVPHALFFAVEVHPRLVAARDRRRRALASVRDLTGGPAVWALLRLLDEMRRHRRDDLESGEPIAEILDALLGEESAPASRPRWLADVERELSEGFRDPVSLRALAERAGVHPVHASRVFRRENGCTMRTFLQRQRVLNACRAILDGQRGLAAIAAESGFCDQAHMTHVFRQVTGMTPTAYRRSRG